jgi:primosomal protein N' (replication factor Y)
MTERFAGLQLPKITLIDLKRQYHRKEMYDHFSDPLVDRIREELARGKQVILFQNRRGYAPMIVCRNCGTTPKCINCDVPMTLHLRDHRLTCHYCGYTIPIPMQCPNCGGVFKVQGFGTERLEEEVQKLFPEARVMRMDLDSTAKKSAYQDIINAFGRHEVDILIGTQMVTKGLHFDDVSLVAVLSADHLFNQPDFRNYERAYQMLEQVSGRAGRKGTQGEVIIQTFDPANPIFTYLMNHDYESFYNEQLTERQSFHYVPFSRMLTVMLRHRNEARVKAAASALQQRLMAVFGTRCSVVIEPSVARIQNLYLRTIQLRIEANANYARAKQMLHEQVAYVLSLPECKNVQVLMDVDPQ